MVRGEVSHQKGAVVFADDKHPRSVTIPSVADVLDFFEEIHRAAKTRFYISANSINALDKAILRSGRLHQIVKFNIPSLEERAAFIAGLPISAEEASKLIQDTENFSYADLALLRDCLTIMALPTALTSVLEIRSLS